MGFDGDEYSQKISLREYSWDELAKNIYKKRRAIASSMAAAATGLVAAHVSGGTSLVGTVWSTRNIRVEMKKLDLLEAEWARRGQKKLEKRAVNDIVIPIFLASAVGTLAFTVDIGIANESAEAAHAAARGCAYEFHGHLIGAYWDGIERALSQLGTAVHSIGYVSPPMGRETQH